MTTAPDRALSALIQSTLDAKTKPPGSLGRIEALAAQIAMLQGATAPTAETCVLHILAGDHGMAEAGVSAYPQAVTRQMVLNFLDGGAAATVFARSLGASVRIVDAGVAGAPIDHPELINRKIAPGTANAIEANAMTRVQFEAAFAEGLRLGAAITEDVA